MPSADSLERQAAAKKKTSANVANVAATQAMYRSLGSTNTAPPVAPESPSDNPPVYYAAPEAAAAAPAAAAVPDTSVETLTKTPEYMARERAIAAAMELFGANQATDTARYNENYTKSLRDLGYDTTSGFDRGALMSSGQRATTSGKAYNALSNDFAARGMLQSGAYQAQQGVLGTQLEDQRLAIDQAKLQFGQDQQAKLAAQNAANEEARRAALQEAKQAILERYAMGV